MNYYAVSVSPLIDFNDEPVVTKLESDPKFIGEIVRRGKNIFIEADGYGRNQDGDLIFNKVKIEAGKRDIVETVCTIASEQWYGVQKVILEE